MDGLRPEIKAAMNFFESQGHICLHAEGPRDNDGKDVWRFSFAPRGGGFIALVFDYRDPPGGNIIPVELGLV
jgi:hypothetical protein